MKRTTYIMAGMVLAGLLGAAGSAIILSTQAVESQKKYMHISGTQQRVELPPCKAVVLSASEVTDRNTTGSEEPRILWFDGNVMDVRPASPGEQGAFVLPSGLQPYMETRMESDTLHIALRIPQADLPESYGRSISMKLPPQGLSLVLPAGVERLCSRAEELELSLHGFSTDTLTLQANGTVLLEDCRIGSLRAESSALYLQSGEVEDLYLDLDLHGEWTSNVAAFHIGTEHLTGSGWHSCTYMPGRCEKTVWTPKDDSSTLAVKLSEGSTIAWE